MEEMFRSTTTEAEENAHERAENQHVTMVHHAGSLDIVFDFDTSDDTHIVHVEGTDATMCTCPHHQKRGVYCKHMAAAENFEYIDEFDLDHMRSGE